MPLYQCSIDIGGFFWIGLSIVLMTRTAGNCNQFLIKHEKWSAQMKQRTFYMYNKKHNAWFFKVYF
jgi:hypothetical protein